MFLLYKYYLNLLSLRKTSGAMRPALALLAIQSARFDSVRVLPRGLTKLVRLKD